VVVLLILLLLLALTGALAFVVKVALGIALGLFIGVVAVVVLLRWRIRRALFGDARRRGHRIRGSRVEVLDRDHRVDI
jgi:membrane protein implicated in regulation of membrane protease activity